MIASQAVTCFLDEWFGVEGRELGRPERFFVEKPEDLLRHIKYCEANMLPCYMSVQPYSTRDQPCAIEKLFFDFDCEAEVTKAWKDALAFSQTLRKYYNVEPLIKFSGRKGYHVYVFLEKPVYFTPDQLDLAVKAYDSLQKRLLRGLKLETLDPSPLGDIKRLARVPFSVHEATGSLCAPVNQNLKPYVPESLAPYRTLKPELFAPVLRELKAQALFSILGRAWKKPRRTAKVRPCIQAALKQPLDGGNGHLMRLAVAVEFLHADMKTEDVAKLFQAQPDFSLKRSFYFVRNAQKKRYKPFKCQTIRKLGFCLTNCKMTKKPSGGG